MIFEKRKGSKIGSRFLETDEGYNRKKVSKLSTVLHIMLRWLG